MLMLYKKWYVGKASLSSCIHGFLAQIFIKNKSKFGGIECGLGK